MTRRTIAVVSAGVSQPSTTRLLADQLAGATRRELERAGSTVDIAGLELRELAHDITNNLLTGFPSPTLRRAIDRVVSADGLVAVTPLYNASYNGLFKSFFDVVDADALTGKPVLIGATGGTARHSLALEHALRPLFGYLSAVVAPTAVFAAAPDWGSDNAAGTALAARVERAGRELADLVRQRDPHQPTDEYADVTPFEQLLTGR